MNRLRLAALALTASCCGTALAQSPPTTGSHVDAFYSNLDFEVDTQIGEGSIDGHGGGLDVWINNGGPGVFTAEYQANDLDGTVQGTEVDADTRMLRTGLGAVFYNTSDFQTWIRAEYVDFDGDADAQGIGSADDRQRGWAAHLGGQAINGSFRSYAEIGYADLDEVDGIEYTIGLNYQPGTIGGFVEFRQSRFEIDDVDIDVTLSDVRAGVRLSF